MSQYLIEQIEATNNIKVRLSTQVVEVSGQKQLESITLEESTTGKVETVTSQALFVFIGAKPNTNWLHNFVLRDQKGFILTGSDSLQAKQKPESWTVDRDPFLLETSVPGIFATGDVRYQSVKRVASAVGEGSVAVQFVHQYLASF
jgi:thioredoxin reductase (NADPH)